MCDRKSLGLTRGCGWSVSSVFRLPTVVISLRSLHNKSTLTATPNFYRGSSLLCVYPKLSGSGRLSRSTAHGGFGDYFSLRKLGKVLLLPQYVTTSARRHEKVGLLRSVLFMWYLRTLYKFGVSPEQLQRMYVDIR